MQEPETGITPSDGGTYTVEIVDGETIILVEFGRDQLDRLRGQCKEALANGEPGDFIK